MVKERTLQLLYGTTAQNNAYTGAIAEITVDSDLNQLRVHDGTTAGGHKIGDTSFPHIVEKQDPSDQNGYTWYRKWSDGWVEQGGYFAAVVNQTQINLPIEMSDANYIILLGQVAGGAYTMAVNSGGGMKTTTGFKTYSNVAGTASWQASGMAAA